MTTTQQIIDEFHTIIGDSTELSSDEELALLNKIYSQVISKKDWEFLKKEVTGSISGTDITQPTDFSNLTSNKIIYLGTNYDPFRVIPFNERRLYVNQNNVFYYDARQGKFVALKTQSDTYSFDYIFVPPALTLAVTPVFPSRFWSMLAFYMASDNDFIQLSEKARSYAPENRARGDSFLADMEMWNSKLEMVDTYGN